VLTNLCFGDRIDDQDITYLCLDGVSTIVQTCHIVVNLLPSWKHVIHYLSIFSDVDSFPPWSPGFWLTVSCFLLLHLLTAISVSLTNTFVLMIYSLTFALRPCQIMAYSAKLYRQSVDVWVLWHSGHLRPLYSDVVFLCKMWISVQFSWLNCTEMIVSPLNFRVLRNLTSWWSKKRVMLLVQLMPTVWLPSPELSCCKLCLNCFKLWANGSSLNHRSCGYCGTPWRG
jgi:hypothetical protein